MQQALMQRSVNLRTVLQDVRNEFNQLRLAISEIAAGNSDLSARTESQAASLEETATSMEQINGTVKQSADAAERGARLAHETSQVTLLGTRRAKREPRGEQRQQTRCLLPGTSCPATNAGRIGGTERVLAPCNQWLASWR
ncbi:hypothetical protein VSR34_25000 [Paraburkholderia sp. JHI2823]|uniref:hypothetical protein n=1 Tax=Paraburkholderia sp. JHI2823 TaxID=3112960 RepID=UPI0031813129